VTFPNAMDSDDAVVEVPDGGFRAAKAAKRARGELANDAPDTPRPTLKKKLAEIMQLPRDASEDLVTTRVEALQLSNDLNACKLLQFWEVPFTFVPYETAFYEMRLNAPFFAAYLAGKNEQSDDAKDADVRRKNNFFSEIKNLYEGRLVDEKTKKDMRAKLEEVRRLYDEMYANRESLGRLSVKRAALEKFGHTAREHAGVTFIEAYAPENP
jgi:predicted metalloendopeptidase